MELSRELRKYHRNGIMSARELGNLERAYELMLEEVPPKILKQMRGEVLEKLTWEQQQRLRRLRTQT
jgi:hypothetical protein